ncbi:protein PET100 homolog, mitochondrial isoform X1 [Tachyglossus aculeatus]|uniref:protein PET100 homolog, mitochondrial isoform X1 n=1 Tax=Tachyglossus aculeatus TaxID=9261 RepID=UPI0018F722D8|nr:protein PET100 homolog, mitochondrial isoform X1 [Tachyglossus aculeatus]
MCSVLCPRSLFFLRTRSVLWDVMAYKMVLYLSFPVAMFWISNQADYFEEYVIKRKREIYPPEREDQRKELEDFKERMRKQREEKRLQAIQH